MSALQGKKEKNKTSVPILLYFPPNYRIFFPQTTSSLVPGIITTIVFSEAGKKGLSKLLRCPEHGTLLLTLLLSLASVKDLSFPDIQATD